MRVGIAFKINLIVLATVLLLGGTLGWFFVVEEERTLRSELDRRIELLGEHLAAHISADVVAGDYDAVDAALIGSIVDREIAYVFVKSADGEVRAGRWVAAARGSVVEFDHPVREYPDGARHRGAGVRFGEVDEAREGRVVGSIALGVDLSQLEVRRLGLLARTASGVVGAALIAALVGAGFVRLLLRSSITPLLEGIRGVGAGDLRRRLAIARRQDEMGEIGRAFNDMAERLATTLVSQTDLESTVAHRTEQLTEALAARTRAQEAVAEREAHVRLLLESTAEAIYGISPDGLCTFCNPACARMLGYSAPEELIGRNMHALVHHSAADGGKVLEEDCRIYRTLRDRKGYHSDDELLWRADGTRFPVEIWSYPMFRDGQGAGAVVTFVDLTERRRLEGELLTMRKLESLGVLAGGIAHDFNNLLMGILGNISLAREVIHDPVEATELLGEAEQATLRTRSLTQQLLTFSRGGTPVKKVITVRAIVEESSRFALSGSSVRAEHDFAPDLWAVEADGGQLGQVVHNLVINAVQAMPRGGLIRISCANVELADGQVPSLPAGPYVRLEVTDQGSGIPPEHLPRIFDPYFTTRAGGHGLGLASVYSITHKHGGHVTVTSRQGEGTTFDVYLPAATRAAAPEPRAAQAAPAARERGHVLVMDDEPAVRKVAMVILARLGFEVEGAADGGEAVARVRAASERGQRFDLLLMDLTVPGGMGGAEAMKQIRAIDPGVVGVATSGYSNDPVMASFGDYGFAGTVAKPYTVADLTQAISGALAKKAPPESPPPTA